MNEQMRILGSGTLYVMATFREEHLERTFSAFYAFEWFLLVLNVTVYHDIFLPQNIKLHIL